MIGKSTIKRDGGSLLLEELAIHAPAGNLRRPRHAGSCSPVRMRGRPGEGRTPARGARPRWPQRATEALACRSSHPTSPRLQEPSLNLTSSSRWPSLPAGAAAGTRPTPRRRSPGGGCASAAPVAPPPIRRRALLRLPPRGEYARPARTRSATGGHPGSADLGRRSHRVEGATASAEGSSRP